jgi:dTDP-4-amino-4,6-dideoxygalactose transaminase
MSETKAPLLLTSGPALGDAELRAVAEVFADGYLGMGETVAAFERELAEWLGGGVRVAAVSSGTSALHLACAAIGLKSGDEVLVPANTFVACFQAVSATGADPVACDIDPATGLLDMNDARRRITARTRAVLPVHYAGFGGDFPALLDWAATCGLRVIDDAAHAFGGRSHGRLFGSFGDVTCFSFDPIKNITCGEGGAVVTRDEEVDRRVRAMRRLGIERVRTASAGDAGNLAFDVIGPGWRYHMPNLLAAIGRVQLGRFESEIKPRRLGLAELYRVLLAGVPRLGLPPAEDGVVPHIVAVSVPAEERETLRGRLRAAGFETSVQYPPANRLTRFRSPPLPGAEQWFRESFTLPLHQRVREDQVRTICKIVREHLEACAT